jgi:hypothetical protein
MDCFRVVCVTGTSGPFLLPACWWRGGYRPYFENYTVDASILETIFGSFHFDDHFFDHLFNFELSTSVFGFDSDLM